MGIIVNREESLKCMEMLIEKKVCMAIFCTASHWNTEAILLAADRFARKYEIDRIPIAVAMTLNYRNMPQVRRVTYSGDTKAGFLSIMEHMRVLCGCEGTPYHRVTVLPHLDHADPSRDFWALTDGLSYLSSVMFDMQAYSLEDNINFTKEYVRRYGHKVLVEGVMEQLAVEGIHEGRKDDDYVSRAEKYCRTTGVDFLVADLGTEQQSSSIGKCVYLADRARSLTKSLGRSMLVLHGTSCLTEQQIRNISNDGVVRVNMWTRIAKESGQYAAEKLLERMPKIKGGDFEAAESRQYIYDSIEKAAEIMEGILEVLGYKNLA